MCWINCRLFWSYLASTIILITVKFLTIIIFNWLPNLFIAINHSNLCIVIVPRLLCDISVHCPPLTLAFFFFCNVYSKKRVVPPKAVTFVCYQSEMLFPGQFSRPVFLGAICLLQCCALRSFGLFGLSDNKHAQRALNGCCIQVLCMFGFIWVSLLVSSLTLVKYLELKFTRASLKKTI